MVAFVTGLYLGQDTEGGQVHISYGAADIESRLMSVKVGWRSNYANVCDMSYVRGYEPPSRRSHTSWLAQTWRT